MTKEQKNVLAQPYFDGLKWHRDVGQEFDISKLDKKVVDKMVAKGYLMSAKEFQASRNPEAAEAQAQADAASEHLQIIYAALPGVTSPEGAVVAIQDLKSKAPDGETSALIAQGKVLREELAKLFPNAKGADGLLGAVKQAKESAANPGDAAALAEYREYVGELLPAGYPERKLLLGLGYLTVQHVATTDDETLKAEDGLGDKKVEAIRKVTPYTPGE